jgi:hypothetical protein
MSEGEESAEEGTNLEHILQGWAEEEYQKARLSGDERAYFKQRVHDTAAEFKLPQYVVHHVLDFAVDRYVFHRRHKELDPADAKRETVIDTYQYMLELKNNFPLVNNDRPRLRDTWR